MGVLFLVAIPPLYHSLLPRERERNLRMYLQATQRYLIMCFIRGHEVFIDVYPTVPLGCVYQDIFITEDSPVLLPGESTHSLYYWGDGEFTPG